MDLRGEVSRRESLTDENSRTNEKLRALALELAADPKYAEHLADFACFNVWLTSFR